jgi:hypothetical protein
VDDYDVHRLFVLGNNNNANYQIALVVGGSIIGETFFKRGSAQNISAQPYIQCEIQAGGSQLSVQVASDVAGATMDIVALYHDY